MISKLALVFVGAGLGGVARFGVGALVQRVARGHFPWGTLAINVTGCFAMGALTAFAGAGRVAEDQRLFWMVGILGGYTTFSTYGYEAETLVRERKGVLAFAYAAGSVALGWAGVLAGRFLAGA